MTAHTVGHYENMAFLFPTRAVGSFLDGKGILIVAPPDPHISHTSMFNLIEKGHAVFPFRNEAQALLIKSLPPKQSTKSRD
jgi:hypothetical protein